MQALLLLFCLLASLLPAHARFISYMKSQPGMFVSSISGPSAPTTCMPIATMPLDTLQFHKLRSKLQLIQSYMTSHVNTYTNSFPFTSHLFTISPFKLHDHLFIGKVRPFEQPGFLFVGNSSEEEKCPYEWSYIINYVLSWFYNIRII